MTQNRSVDQLMKHFAWIREAMLDHYVPSTDFCFVVSPQEFVELARTRYENLFPTELNGDLHYEGIPIVPRKQFWPQPHGKTE